VNQAQRTIWRYTQKTCQ